MAKPVSLASSEKKIRGPTRRVERGVPFKEMCRLMRVYGSTKCLRKRQKMPCGADSAKIDSVKRKFYRWFPDLDERFEKDENGLYQPRAGHEFELRYREEMRAKDGEILVKKRARCRKQRHHGITEANGEGPKAKLAPTKSNIRALISPVHSPPNAMLRPPLPRQSGQVNTGTGTAKLEFDHNHMASGDIPAEDDEPVDHSFVAEEGIFDDVEKDFFGGAAPVAITWSSCSSLEDPGAEGSNSEESDGTPSIADMLDKSIEECCEEILGTDEDNASVSDYIADMFTS